MADIQRNLDARARDYDTANRAYEPLISSPRGSRTLQGPVRHLENLPRGRRRGGAHARKRETAQARAVNAQRATPAGRSMDAGAGEDRRHQRQGCRGVRAESRKRLRTGVPRGDRRADPDGADRTDRGRTHRPRHRPRHRLGADPDARRSPPTTSRSTSRIRASPTKSAQIADTLEVFKQALVAKQAADEAAAHEASAKMRRGRNAGQRPRATSKP